MFSVRPLMGWLSGNVNASKMRRDVIYYELPAPGAKQFIYRACLAENVGSTGVLRFILPAP